MPELFRAYLLGGIYRLDCTESSRFGWGKHRPRAPGGHRAASPTQAEMRACQAKVLGRLAGVAQLASLVCFPVALGKSVAIISARASKDRNVALLSSSRLTTDPSARW